jgi:phytanoyl-CoA hydroxylase
MLRCRRLLKAVKAPNLQKRFLITLSKQQKERFQKDGFLIIPNFLSRQLASEAADRIERCFKGTFETGIYPDEWHWREGMSLPDITREICNAWKRSD